MQFELHPDLQSSAATDSILIGQKHVPLLFVENHRARRYVLRVRPDGTARITIPRRGSFRAARDFAQKNVDWIHRQLQRFSARPVENRAWPAGSRIFFRGESVTIAPDADGKPGIVFADQTVRLSRNDQDCRPPIERHLQRLAKAELPPRVFHFAQLNGLKVERVTVRNQKSRWGSCSRRGTVSLNWRLIQAPQFVADYIILHELMHLRQMNHSPKFWREVELVCPGFREAERWLKANVSLLR